MQTKRQSLTETLTNTFTGLIGSWLITLTCIYLFQDKWAAATAAALACTVWSIVRGYAIRRYFNNAALDKSYKSDT